MKNKYFVIIFIFILFSCFGFNVDKYVKAVQDGKYLNTDVTNKTILESVFKSTSWKSYKSKIDSTICVSFTGKCIYDQKITTIEVVYLFNKDMSFSPIHFYVDGVDDILLFAMIVAKIYVGID